MALLIVDLDKYIGNARAWRDTFGEQLPDLEIRIWPDAGNLAGYRISRLCASRLRFPPGLSEFESHVQPLCRGRVPCQHPKRPNAPLLKIEPPGGDPLMTEYVVMHVLRL